MPKSLKQSGITSTAPFVKADDLVGVPFVIETASHPRRDDGNRERGIAARDVIDFQIRFTDKKVAILTLTAYSARTRIADSARREELGPVTIAKQAGKNGDFYVIIDAQRRHNNPRPQLYGEEGEGMTRNTPQPGKESDAIEPISAELQAEEDDDLPF